MQGLFVLQISFQKPYNSFSIGAYIVDLRNIDIKVIPEKDLQTRAIMIQMSETMEVVFLTVLHRF